MRTSARWLLLALVTGLTLSTTALAQSKAASAGHDVFQERCSVCHQATGTGIPEAFPPLAGNVPLFLEKGEQGRASLEHIVLFGMQGKITALGNSFDGAMPTWGPILSDQYIADVLNYVSHAWGNDALLPDGFSPFTPDEIATAREAKLTPQSTHDVWGKLGF